MSIAWKWSNRHRCFVRPSSVPGILERKTRDNLNQGFVVRTRIVDPSTGRPREIKKVLPTATLGSATQWLEQESARVRSGSPNASKATPMRFAEFAASLLEHKIKVGEIRSAAGKKHWGYTLEHLIDGVVGKSGATARGFGEMFLDRIAMRHVELWKEDVAGLIAAGDYAPPTCNGWFAILRVVLKAAKKRLQLPTLATEGVSGFDESEHVTNTEAEPNALLPDEVPLFLERLRAVRPEHFAMIYLGLVTGLRPSSLRPLRRRGADADVIWDTGRVLVRRSHTRHDEVMLTTKQRRRYAIDLPSEVMDVLAWHVATQLKTDEQQASDLLFPAITGGFRSATVLNKPLAEVAEDLMITKTFTQRAVRRSFNDLARAAGVPDLVTRSISGHLTEKMHHHYSTVNGAEQRAARAKVIGIAGVGVRPEPPACSDAIDRSAE